MKTMSVADPLAEVTARRTLSFWLLAFFLANLTASVVVLVSYGSGSDDTLTPTWVVLISGLAMWVSYLYVLTAVSVKYGSGSMVNDYRIRFAWSDLWGVPLGIGSQFILVTAVMYPLTKLFPDAFSVDDVEKRARDLADSATGVWMLVLFAVVVIGAPVVEEIVYRGFLQQGLERSIRPTTALIATSAIFAAIHFQPVEFPGLFAFALVLGLTYRRTQRLGLPIVTHMAFNASGLVVVTLL
jgi:membrane protease YdiL (CAAX protease family)